MTSHRDRSGEIGTREDVVRVKGDEETKTRSVDSKNRREEEDRGEVDHSGSSHTLTPYNMPGVSFLLGKVER